MSNKIIEVQNIKVNVTSLNEKDFICISDIAKAKSDKSRAADVIRNWLRNRSTLDFLTAWEQLGRAIKYLNKMSKQELIEELIQVFDYGPEWIYNDFVKRNLY